MRPGVWLATALEWTLLGIGLGCLGTYGYVTLDAHRIQRVQVAGFERAAAVRAAYVPAAGGLVGMLEVPRLRLSAPVVEGDDDAVLQASAGHLPDTPLPWQPGNSAIAGHRDGLFRPLKDVKVGDEITFRSTRDELRYRVTATAIVEPDDLSVLASRRQDALTLITCYPFYYVGAAPQRFVVHAERVAGASPAAGDRQAATRPPSN
ncbi:MAG: class D sortase [Vicinamibacterales bacterium]